MRWKGTYRCAVTISVDFDAETLWSGTFKLTTPSPLSRGDYDIRAGIPRILALLRKHEIPATFMVPGQVIDDHPDACREIAGHDVEIGYHGYYHESVLEIPDRGGARADATRDRPDRGDVRDETAWQPVAAVRTRAEHGGPPRGVRLRLRLEPVRPRRAIPAARPRPRRGSYATSSNCRSAGSSTTRPTSSSTSSRTCPATRRPRRCSRSGRRSSTAPTRSAAASCS